MAWCDGKTAPSPPSEGKGRNVATSEEAAALKEREVVEKRSLKRDLSCLSNLKRCGRWKEKEIMN